MSELRGTLAIIQSSPVVLQAGNHSVRAEDLRVPSAQVSEFPMELLAEAVLGSEVNQGPW